MVMVMVMLLELLQEVLLSLSLTFETFLLVLAMFTMAEFLNAFARDLCRSANLLRSHVT